MNLNMWIHHYVFSLWSFCLMILYCVAGKTSWKAWRSSEITGTGWGSWYVFSWCKELFLVVL